jgi:DNA-binding response OmpR family regulator
MLHPCTGRMVGQEGAVDVYGRTTSILVVEDDHAVAELIRELLNQVPGWGATVVHDAAAAREVFRHVRVEVLVLDVDLPGISGLELLALLRQDQRWDEPPVLLMSAEPDQGGILQAVREGLVARFLRKPFDVDELLEEVASAISGRNSAVTSALPEHRTPRA